MEHARKQQVPKETITSSDTTDLTEFDKKTTLFEKMIKSKSFNKSLKQRALYHALMESILGDEDAIDEDPEWNKDRSAENNPTWKWLSDLVKSEKPSRTFDDLMSALIDFSAFFMNCLQISKLTQDIMELYKFCDATLISLRDTLKDMANNLEMGYTSVMPRRGWSNWDKKKYRIMIKDINRQLLDRRLMRSLKKFVGGREYGEELRLLQRYPFDLSKPLPLVMSGNRQIIPVYLQGGSIRRTYMTSLTKTKAVKYDLPGIKDMVPNLWSPIKVAYYKHALLGTLHFEPKRQSFYGYDTNRVSKHDVYSNKRILAVKNFKVKEWYGYGHLEEIEV
nr:hypothetical protein [Tanacetum cinerariifolium]